MNGTGDLSATARARAARREELRADLERLQGRRARSNDPKTQARLDTQIARVQGRIARA